MSNTLHPPPVPSQTATLEAQSGQTLQVHCSDDSTLVLRGQGGTHMLRIEWQAGRAKLCIEDGDIAVRRVGNVDIQCERFSVEAKQDIDLKSMGDLRAGATHRLDLSAPEVSVVSTLGDLVLKANDIVRAIGERIYLNTDKDAEQGQQRAREFLKRLLGATPPKDC